MRFVFYFVCTLVLLVSACDNNKPVERKKAPVEEKPLVATPDFNADSAYAFVEKQVSFGERYPGSDAHQKTGDYLIDYLEKLEGFEVRVQDFEALAFDGKLLKGRNILASYNPDMSKRVMVAAHWDTRPFADQDDERQNEPILGANDGGSGVGILLELARTLSISKNQKPSIGIDLMFFDLEDYGNNGTKDSYCLGSQYWSKNKMPQDYKAYYGILLDMVGASGAKFAMEGHSMQFAPSVVDKVWNMAHRIGYGGYFPFEKSPPIIDDHYYVNTQGGIPMIDIIEYNPKGKSYFGKYWHTHDDNMSIIDKNTLKAVGQTVLHTLYNEENKAIQ